MKKETIQKIVRKASPLLFPVAGVLAIIWFLIRVVPKPSRAAYPCQRAAAGLGGGFIMYLLAMLVPAAFLRRRSQQVIRYRLPIIALSGIALMSVMVPFLVPQAQPAIAARGFTPVDAPNQPVGTARGIYPGRVVWVRDTNATLWDGSTGFWWSDANTSQFVVDSMLSRSLQLISGGSTKAAAWDALFRFSNVSRGLGNFGYQAGEKIVIKINSNQDAGQNWDNGGFQSPHLVYALVNQLIAVVGVAGADITIADSSRYIGDPIYNKIRGNPDFHFQAVRFVVRPDLSRNGRLAASPDYGHPIKFVKPNPAAADIPDHYPPACYTEAGYIINLSLLRSHQLFGVTLAAKNHFGSVFNGSSFSPSLLHGFGIAASPANGIGDPHCHPVLIGHEQLGGKTVLYLMDGLYTAVHQGSKTITRWQTLGNDYFSSLLASLDPVAIDSVALDFLRSEPTMQIPPLNVNACNYLHEAAQAGNPPSGAVYDPEGDGTPLQNLGVHEHWNNSTDRQYSRDLGTGSGIEFVKSGPFLAVVKPNGGERLNKNTICRISWETTGISTPLKILLWREGVRIGTIAENLNPLSGGYSWRAGYYIGGSAPANIGYKVKVKAPGIVYDACDAPFTLVKLRVKSPNGGENLGIGSAVPISWGADGNLGLLQISLWREGTFMGIIADNLDPALGRYSWPAGSFKGGIAPAGTGYLIRVRETGTLVLDNSDSAFTLQ
jgi:hypothetical protein